MVRRQHFLLLHLNAQHALVDDLDLFNQRDAEGQPGARFAKLFTRFVGVYDPINLTIAADDGLLRFGHYVNGHAHKDERGDYG